MIDRATVDRITEAANIVDVVSEFVTLRRSGASYRGLCPFHDDTTPSFYVSPSRNVCKCFSCGKGGTPVSFIMEHEQMTYPEALRWLARKYNIEIKERKLTSEEKAAESERESMFIVNEWAAGFFESTLHDSSEGVAIGMQYFRSRGIRDDIIRKFRLGFSPQSRQALSNAAVKAGYKKEYLIKTGLCYQRENGNEPVDRFAGRVIFPWISNSGKVVGFGGRLLDKRTKGVSQKYVNSPDSEIYHKERELYGIYMAKRAITKENMVYMVEGYTDVIAMHQCGIENVVANSGTALSVHQIRMLRRFTRNIVLLYDGDLAGIHAAMRGTDMLLAEGMNVKVLLLPDGDDPDSFSRKHSATEFKQYIESHQTDFIRFKADVTLRDVSDPIKRSEAINSIVKSISIIPDQITRDTYITDCSHRFGINEMTLITSMNRMIRNEREQRARAAGNQSSEPTTQLVSHGAKTPATAAAQSSQPQADIERMLIQMVIRHGETVIFDNVETDDGTTSLTVAQYIALDLDSDNLAFSNDLYNRILREAGELSNDKNFVAESHFIGHEDIEISSTAADLAVDRIQLSKSLRMNIDAETLRNKVRHLMLDFRKNYVKNRMDALSDRIKKNHDDAETTAALMQEYMQMQQLQARIYKELRTSPIM